MSDDNDHIEIDLEDPAKVEKAPVDDIQVEEKVEEKIEKSAQKSAKDKIDPEEGINDLKTKLLEEQRLRFEAENRAREAVQRQYRAQNETEEANFALVEGAMRTLSEENEHIKAQYKEALAIGDYDKVADLQEAMAENKVRLSELRRGHEYMKSQRENTRRETPPPPQPADPVEALASNLSPRSADWIRRNPDYAKDQRLFQKMVAAHQMVTADGIQPDTDDYFEAIEDTLKIRKTPEKTAPPADTDDATFEAAKPIQRRVAPPAAPVSRSNSTPTNRSNVVRLTRAEIETARDMGMTEQEYARNKQLLQKEGRI
jgi:hypothetical protein